jgi:glycosyltransferase involved in cell wall biosynthesis
LVKRGHEVTLLTSHIKGLPRDETVNGIRVIRISSLRREPYNADFWSMATYILAGLFAGARLVHRWEPEIFHVHFAVPAGPIAWALSRIYGIPYVLTTHLGDVPGGVPEKTALWFRLILPFTPPIWRDAARVIAVSRYTRELALANYPVNIQVIPNGVDLKELDPGVIRIGEPPRIIFAGRFMPQKNPLHVVEVLSQLKDLPWTCVMAGDGRLQDQVKQAIRQYGMESRFTITGWINPDEVLHWLAKSDILFMPSLAEGLPVVGIQALAMGLAIVASKVGGFVDIVEEGQNGFLLSSIDTAGMRDSLRIMLSDSNTLLYARQCSRKLARHFDLTKVVSAYEKTFIEIVPTKG